MSLKTSQVYQGFRLKKQETISELNSLALEFEHLGTGAELLVLENDDDNKVFSVTFRTPPENDRGVAHILEHSVLCGSRKFPVKEPFMELMKGSLKTFLNAMTFPDKTMYPVASRNQKDFFNLMNVYLDAVFFPRITKEIFMQEGWHHELESAENDLVYKGVVFNEMKGVFSDPESILERYMNHSLFPDTTYGYESGGDPDFIPDLTYEEFKAFHEKYYHPSNSRIFLYGDGNTLEYLKFMEENFLKDFSRKIADSSISLQPRFQEPQRKEIFYPVSKDESKEKKTFIFIGMLLDLATDQEHCLSFSILSHLLVGTPASPLRKALIDSGLGSEVIGGGFDDQRQETMFAVGLKGTERENEQEIVDLIFDTLRNLVQNGIDSDMIAAAVNTVEFKLREANFGGFPKGIVYNIQALGSWLYDADPLMHLKYDALMDKIRQESRNSYFESMIEKYLLENPHRSLIIGIPQSGLTDDQDRRVKEKLEKYKEALKGGDLNHLVEETRTLQQLQMAPDSLEALQSLPQLGLEDLNPDTPQFPLEVKKESHPKVLFHDLFTNKIGYIQVGFNTEGVPLEKIQYLPLLGKLILEMGTQKRSFVEISQKIGIHTGGIRSSHFSSLSLKNRNDIISYVFFNGKAVLNKLGNLFDLFEELLGSFNFDNHKRLVDIIRSSKADMESSLIPSGNHYVLSRLQSYYSRIGQYDEITGGITYFRFLEGLLKRAEENPESVAEQFKQVAKGLFTRDNLLINITSEASDYEIFEKKIASLTALFPENKESPADLVFETPQLNEAFLTASTIQYVGKGANLYSLGFKYSGAFEVFKAILNTAFLWEKVRMQGGAYGCSASFDYYSGDFGLVSYRDPNLNETLQVYDDIFDFFSNLDLPQEELTKFIIGCVGRLDPPLSPDRKGSISMIEHLTGMTYEFRQKRRDEVLRTTIEDLKNFAPLFQQVKESGHVCVLGNEEKIKEAEELFQHLEKVFH